MIKADPNRPERRSEFELKGWHVLLIMLGFFGVMFSVNGVFLFHAITSFPGEDVKKSYVQGLNYNDTLAQRAAQAERGWTAEAGWQGGQLIFRLKDDAGEPLSNMSVMGEVRRQATRAHDHTVLFSAVGGGEYTVSEAKLGAGLWVLRISVYDPEAETLLLNVEKEILVP